MNYNLEAVKSSTQAEALRVSLHNDMKLRKEFTNRLIAALGAKLGMTPYNYTDGESKGLEVTGNNCSLRIYISLDTRKGKLNISANPTATCVVVKNRHNGPLVTSNNFYPRLKTGDATVGAFRGVEVIAKEIERRVLPLAKAAYAEIIKRRDEMDAHQSGSLSLAARIAGTMGVDLGRDCNRQPAARVSLSNLNFGGYGDVTVNSESSAEFNIRGLNAAQSLKLAEFLKNL